VARIACLPSRLIGICLATGWLAACSLPTTPPSPTPAAPSLTPAASSSTAAGRLATPQASASASSAPETLTALEAIRRAEPIIAALGSESWLITAEALPMVPGGRLGASPEWLLLYRQLDGPLLRVAVSAPDRVTYRELPGGKWEGGRLDRFRVDPHLVAHDSQWAIRIADAIGGGAFLHRFPGSSRSIVLDHAFGDPLTWTVDYQTPDRYYALTVIVEDATGRILHIATCDYSPAAMAQPGLPNCVRDFEPKDPPFIPLIQPSPDWDLA
jgi:hypothetical protein